MVLLHLLEAISGIGIYGKQQQQESYVSCNAFLADRTRPNPIVIVEEIHRFRVHYDDLPRYLSPLLKYLFCSLPVLCGFLLNLRTNK